MRLAKQQFRLPDAEGFGEEVSWHHLLALPLSQCHAIAVAQRGASKPPVRVRPAASRGWASEPPTLAWRATLAGRMPDLDLAWAPWLVAENVLAKWTVQQTKFEALAICEPREPGRPRHELGRFRSPAEAMAACAADYERRLAERAAQSAEPKPATGNRRHTRRRPVSLVKTAAG